MEINFPHMNIISYICSMDKIKSNTKLRRIFIVLILLSAISTLHIMYNYHADLLVSESVSFFNMTDSVKIKEVGFVEFMVEAFKRVIFTYM